jgi:hypothetical protein
MKQANAKGINGLRIAAVVALILFTIAAHVRADSPLVPYTFSPGTVIKSGEVNQNFTTLSNALPGMKWVSGAPLGFSLTTQWQTVTQLTVTPPADGIFLIFANNQVAFNLQANGNSMVSFCVSTSQSDNDCRGVFGASFVAPGTASGPALSLPVNSIATVEVTKAVSATFYLLAKKASDNGDSLTLQSDQLFAVFLPRQL